MSAQRLAQYQQEMAEPQDQDSAIAAHAKRVKQEYDNARTRLVDQNFTMKRYPDPLQPRQVVEQYPPGVTPEIEKKWLAMIKTYREKYGS